MKNIFNRRRRDVPLSDSDDMPVWTGHKYETWGEVRRRGWRYTPGDLRLPTDNENTDNFKHKQNMTTSVNPAKRAKIHVRVRRTADDIEMTIPYAAYKDMRNSVDDMIGDKKLYLLGQCTEDGQVVEGGPDLSESDRQSIVG